MKESKRMEHLREQVEVLEAVRRNSKIPLVDLLESHHFLRSWVNAYHLSHEISNMHKVERYIVILGPFWDFLKEHNLELSDHRHRVGIVLNYLRSSHHS